ncbi:SusD/RagB family nutrient-binding outer membrane lipoprotein [Sphingobacterium sp. NGMCC 1.201703]|uniref:SusD/RagB family nutrient-binding outer membrane lipoprotein n=1 Tax=Sphingobacterium sp. NGMCC 1.201703 TaxID=3388657 RepID=UPI0039FD2EA7
MKINKYFVIAGLCTASLSTTISCKKTSFDELYRDPSKVTETTIDKQFTGILFTYRELVIPTYRNYFVTLAPTIHRHIQTVGWQNADEQLTPGAAAIDDRWERYYQGLAQFREFEKIYNAAPESEKNDKKIFYLAAKIFFYDMTQQQVDLHGDIPWSEAGKLSTNGGDYTISYPKYDKATDIYTTMLDDLKAINSELTNIKVAPGILTGFQNQDLVNSGSIDLWKKYCNSLRLRMLTRVGQTQAFSARANQEIADIIANAPLVLDNKDNIQVDIFDVATDINSKGFRDAIESWNNNIAGKVMIDDMVAKADPRLPYMFEPGPGAGGKYMGLDPALASAAQAELLINTTQNPSKVTTYNRSTYSRNQFFPGVLITASEVKFLIAEFKLRSGSDAAAKTAFEEGIKASIGMQQNIRKVSNNNEVAAPTAPTGEQISKYISNVGWEGNKLQLIAMQKWLHFNIIQSVENWSEVRRLNYPIFAFRVAPSDRQKTVPLRWTIGTSELSNNSTNYEAVKAQDNVNTKIFWDVN